MDFLTSHSLIAIVAGLLGLVSLYLWRTKTSHKTKHKFLAPPEPFGALPIIGHLHKLSSHNPIFRSLADIADEYGHIFMFRLGKNPVLVVSNYDAVKECFTTNDKNFASRPRSTHGTHLGYDYAAFGFAAYGPFWQHMRKLVMVELLSARRLETLRHVQISEVEALVNGLYGQCKAGNGFGPTKVVISEWIEHFTLNIITEMIARKRYFKSGREFDGEAERIGKVIKDYMLISGGFVLSDLFPIPTWLDLNGNLKEMKRIGREIDVLIQSWIDEHKMSESSKKQDFIDVMLSLIEDSPDLGYTRDTIIKGTVSVWLFLFLCVFFK